MQKNNTNYRFSCLEKYGKNSLSHLTLSNSVSIFTGDWEGYIAYKNIFKYIIVLGNPIVPDNSLEQALKDLKEWAKSKKLLVFFLICNQNGYKTFKNQGFKKICCGFEPIIDLNKFSLKGNKKSNIRNNINHASRLKLIVEEYKYFPNRDKQIEEEIKRISNEWLQMKKIQEPTFLIRKPDFKNNEGTRYFICKNNNKLVGFLKFSPILGINSYYLEIGRRGKNSPRGTIDYLLVKSFEKFSKEGIQKIHFGPVPYAFLSSDITKYSNLSEKLFIIIKPLFELIYNAKSEYSIKNRYATSWEPNYLYYYPHLKIRILFSLLHSIYPGGIASIFLQKTKYFFRKNNYK